MPDAYSREYERLVSIAFLYFVVTSGVSHDFAERTFWSTASERKSFQSSGTRDAVVALKY